MVSGLASLYSGYVSCCGSGIVISQYPPSRIVEVLWEGRDIPPNPLPTLQSNGHALVHKPWFRTKDSIPSPGGPSHFLTASPMLLVLSQNPGSTSFHCTCLQPSHKEPIKWLSFQFCTRLQSTAGDKWQKSLDATQFPVLSQFHREVWKSPFPSFSTSSPTVTI